MTKITLAIPDKIFFIKKVWVIADPSTSVNFLDLNISIDSNDKIEISTFQKAMNLHLFIPPLSAHRPSCLKGLITGALLCYKKQNNNEGFININTSFLKRMAARGHKLEDHIPLIHEATAAIDKKLFSSYLTNAEPPSNNPNKDQKSLYFHWRYHPHGVTNFTIRYHYNTHLKNHLQLFSKMTLAISRPANLRDKLTRTALQLPPGDTVSSRLNARPHQTV
jgi:hypothetical protein